MYNVEMSSGDKTTEQVVRDLQQGREPEANFHILFQKYHQQVRRFLRRKYLSPEDAEELTQDVFISVYKGLGGLSEPTQFEGWLFRIALNAFRNHIERNQAKKRDGILVDISGDGIGEGNGLLSSGSAADPVKRIIDAERQTAVREAIETLPEQMRRCLQLRLKHELSNPEIAKLMGISVNTVKAHLQQARKVLGERVQAKLGEL